MGMLLRASHGRILKPETAPSGPPAEDHLATWWRMRVEGGEAGKGPTECDQLPHLSEPAQTSFMITEPSAKCKCGEDLIQNISTVGHYSAI